MDNNLDYEKIINTVDFCMLKKFYEEKSLLDIVQVERKEYVHSNFIYWLFNENESHKLGNIPLSLFLNLCLRKNTKLQIPSINVNEINYSISNLNIKKELGIEKYGRLDLEIDFKINNDDFLLIIENKIDSLFAKNQLERYSKWGSDKNKTLILVVLAPNELKDIKDGFFFISYNELLKEVIEPCIYKTESSYTKNILENYLKSLSFGSELKKEAIAVSEYERIIAESIYINNEEDIIKIIKNKDINKDVQDYNVFTNFLNIVVNKNIGKYNKEISEFLKLNITYSFEGVLYSKGNYWKLIKEIFQKSANEYTKYFEFMDLFKSSSSIPIIISEDEIFENKNKKYFVNNNGELYDDETIELENKKYYICHSWYRYEVDEIVEIANSKLNYGIVRK